MPKKVMILMLLAGCLRANPDYCCETALECEGVVDAPRPCEVGVCVRTRCVDVGCDGDEDCDDGLTCRTGACVAPMVLSAGAEQVDEPTPCEVPGVCPAGWPCTENRQCASDVCAGTVCS